MDMRQLGSCCRVERHAFFQALTLRFEVACSGCANRPFKFLHVGFARLKKR